MLTIGSQRPLFDIPAGIAYFNTAYNSPLLNSSRAALVSASHAKSHPWERPPADFFDDAERIVRWPRASSVVMPMATLSCLQPAMD